MPDILNENISWATMPDNGGQTRVEIHTAFSGGAATKTRLNPGFEICKLNNYMTLTPNPAPTTVVSAWWTNLDRWGNVVGLEDRVKMAKFFKVSVRELCRVFLAVRENWNSFEYLAVAALAKPVWAFVGGVSKQVRKQGESKRAPGEKSAMRQSLPGQATQIYIPFLTMAHLRCVRVHRLTDIERGNLKQY
jgi:hypothetical protein